MVTADLDALPALDVVSIEWPDEDVACSAIVKPECLTPAVWWSDCSSCGRTVYACDSHRREDDEWCDVITARRNGAACFGCRTPWKGRRPWRPLR